MVPGNRHTHRSTTYVAHPLAGTWASKRCPWCGADCLIERGVRGPRSFAEAMALKMGKLRLEDFELRDRFWCPHNEAPWHERLTVLEQRLQGAELPHLAAELIEVVHLARQGR